MKVYITTYAITYGIIEREAEISKTYDTMIRVKNKNGYTQCFHKPHWFMTIGEAAERAESMRKKAIELAKKKISKLEKMEFKIKS